MTQLAALNVKITGDTADLQSDLSKAEAGVKRVGQSATTAQTRTKGFTGGLTKLGNVSGQTRAKIQNTSFQLQDIAVQLQGGTKASTVFAQQLPQLLGGFGALGAVLGVVAGIGIPALAFAFSSLGEESKDTEEALDNFVASLNSARELMQTAAKPIEDLRKEFGEFADEIQRASEVAARAALSQALDQYSDAAAGVRANFKTLSSELINYQAAVEAAAIVTNVLGERTTLNAGAFDDASASVTEARSKVEEIAAEMGMGVTEATRLNAALQKISDAQGMDEIAASSAEAVDLIGRMFTEAEKMPPEIAAIVIQLEQVATAAAAGATASKGLKEELEGGADAARSLADEMAFISSLSPEVQARMVVSGVEAGDIPPQALADLPQSEADEVLEKILARRRAARRREDDDGTTRAQANPLVAQLDNLQQSLMTQEEAQIASFERQQETLTSALEQQLLTRQEYNELMEDAEAQHSQRMAGLAVYKYGDTLAQTGQFLGDMASAMQGGNDKMLRIAKVFGAAEALINSYRAYNQVISDPSLPWFAKIPAAVSVLGAGLGMVNAIKGVSSGGGSAGAATGVNGGAAGAAQSTPQTSNNVAIQLTGGDMFSRDQVIQLINGINDAVDDGAQIRLV